MENETILLFHMWLFLALQTEEDGNKASSFTVYAILIFNMKKKNCSKQAFCFSE